MKITCDTIFKISLLDSIVTTAEKVGGIINVTNKQVTMISLLPRPRGTSVDSVLNFQFNFIPTEATEFDIRKSSVPSEVQC